MKAKSLATGKQSVAATQAAQDSPLRVLSLLPGATDTVRALGAANLLIGRTHECDWTELQTLPIVTSDKLGDMPPADLDAAMAACGGALPTLGWCGGGIALLDQGLSPYRTDVEQLVMLRPDVILTQMQVASSTPRGSMGVVPEQDRHECCLVGPYRALRGPISPFLLLCRDFNCQSSSPSSFSSSSSSSLPFISITKVTRCFPIQRFCDYGNAIILLPAPCGYPSMHHESPGRLPALALVLVLVLLGHQGLGPDLTPDHYQSPLEQLLGYMPTVVQLEALEMEGVWRDMRSISEALKLGREGLEKISTLQRRLKAASDSARGRPRPRVVVVQWSDPLFVAGGWVPQLVELAGARDVLGRVEAAATFTAQQLADTRPDVLVFGLCGFGLLESQRLATKALDQLAAECRAAAGVIHRARVIVTDGLRVFSRPGPWLVQSLEVLVEALHGEAQEYGHEGQLWALLLREPAQDSADVGLKVTRGSSVVMPVGAV
ncbi:hypothetical protein Vafri_20953 [Volvox africanus]|uniref:Fe/B12 periplasmic-binding domain-containing protein n=1 Tax=Volvox africanus TaxID=51714 RepID=A0A8J4BSE8_9CHLO|nr:hypothetical protein Vafri_20953 [Volvox africanus]